MEFKRVIQATVVSEEDALQCALENGDTVIVIKGELYEDVLPRIKEARLAKRNKKAGKLMVAVCAVGTVLSGPGAWLLAGAGLSALGMAVGKKYDPELLKKYRIEIKDELEKIYLYKVKGEDRYEERSMTFRE